MPHHKLVCAAEVLHAAKAAMNLASPNFWYQAPRLRSARASPLFTLGVCCLQSEFDPAMRIAASVTPSVVPAAGLGVPVRSIAA